MVIGVLYFVGLVDVLSLMPSSKGLTACFFRDVCCLENSSVIYIHDELVFSIVRTAVRFGV